MARNNTRLELTWIGKENRPRLEPRILLEHAGKSYHARPHVSDHGPVGHRLIFEDEFTRQPLCFAHP